MARMDADGVGSGLEWGMGHTRRGCAKAGLLQPSMCGCTRHACQDPLQLVKVGWLQGWICRAHLQGGVGPGNTLEAGWSLCQSGGALVRAAGSGVRRGVM